MKQFELEIGDLTLQYPEFLGGHCRIFEVRKISDNGVSIGEVMQKSGQILTTQAVYDGKQTIITPIKNVNVVEVEEFT